MTVPDIQAPPPPAEIRGVEGFAGARFAANRIGYLRAFDIEHHTRMVEEKKHRDWWWVGEQPGKWLESAVLTSLQAHDPELDRQARAILARLVAAQEPDGYLGVTDPAVRTAQQPLRGMDPYELYFMLHGLLTAAEQWHDAPALAAARRLGDYFVEHIGPGKAEFWPSEYRPPENRRKILAEQMAWAPPGTERAPRLSVHSAIAGHTVHYGWEGTLLIDPMLRLHELTGDARYLDWCRWVVGRIDTWSGWDAFSNLDRVADGTLGIHELQPYVHAHTFHMNFLGFLRLYRITGDASLLRKVTGAWNDIAARQMYITGGVSVGEHYESGHNLPITGSVVETCATMSWIELTQSLLRLTGDPKYADAIERLLWNHVYAAQTVDGDSHGYHVPLNGIKPGAYYHGVDCCTGSGHRLQSLVPLLAYGAGPDGLYVNQYMSGSARLTLPGGDRVTLRQETDYPAGERIVLHVAPEKPAAFALSVRLPGWCANPGVKVNGEAVAPPRTGTYARIERAWQPGDRVEVTLPMAPRWQAGDHTAAGLWALVRGPLVYALDTVWWPEEAVAALGAPPPDLGRAVAVKIARAGSPAEPSAAPTPASALGPAYRVTVRLPSGREAAVPVLPFANLGQWYRAGGTARPAPRETAFAYAVWVQRAEAAPELAP